MSSLVGNTPVLLAVIAGIVIICVVVLVMGRRIDAKVAGIHVQVHPNGGYSLADRIDKMGDQVDRTERAVVSTAKDLSGVSERVSILESAAIEAAAAASIAAIAATEAAGVAAHIESIVDRRDPAAERRTTG